jgi:hypothetical protein
MLHDIEVLVSLTADADARVRSWAVTRLLLAAPQALGAAVPADVDGWALAVLLGSDGVRGRALDAVAAGDGAACLGVATAVRVGGLIPGLAAAVAGPPPTGAALPAWAALAREAGRADAEVLHALLGAARPAARVEAALCALTLASARGFLASAAADVAAGLPASEDLWSAVDALGAPELHAVDADMSWIDALEAGARRCGAAPPRPVVPAGAARRRAASWVRALVDPAADPLSALLCAAAHARPEPRVVAVAAWRASAPRRGDAVADALAGWSDPATLAAWADPGNAAAWPRLAACPPDRATARLAAAAVRRGAHALSETVGAWLRDDPLAEEGVLLGAVAFAHAPGRVADWLLDPERRLAGLRLAALVHDEQVLEALVGLGPSMDPAERVYQAFALASSGDGAAAAPLAALYSVDDRLPSAPRALYEAIRGAPLGAQ